MSSIVKHLPAWGLTLLVGCTDPPTALDSAREISDSPLEDAPAAVVSELVSAFFGLDDALPMAALGICREAPGRDGMPLVFRRAIDMASLEATDFEVETRSGARARPLCVSLLPRTKRTSFAPCS